MASINEYVNTDECMYCGVDQYFASKKVASPCPMFPRNSWNSSSVLNLFLWLRVVL